MEALQVLFDKVRALLEEHDALDRALPNQAADGDSESDGEESSESKQLKKDYAVKTKEIQLLKKAVPEGNESVRYLVYYVRSTVWQSQF